MYSNFFYNKDVDEDNSTPPPKYRKYSTSTTSQSISKWCNRPLSSKDTSVFESLIIKMCISNGLPFSFVENEETQAVFNFIASGLKLPNRKKLSGKLLLKTSENFQENILKITQSDENGLTATFGGWTNIKQENIWGVVLITSKGQPLIWDAQETNSERSRTEDIIRHIEQLMDKAQKKKINIKAFVSDSAGEYVAAR
jgi:hypothetical protein